MNNPQADDFLLRSHRPSCPRARCRQAGLGRFSGRTIRHGFYFRSSDAKRIRRFRCLSCGSTFSRATGEACFGQKKRHLNEPILQLYGGLTVSQRGCARFLNTHRSTVARKMRFLACLARKEHAQQVADYLSWVKRIEHLQLDEMETFEHTKLKPLSVPLVVTPRRFILAIGACSMPAKGPLAQLSRKKYGKRKDDRQATLKKLLESLQGQVCPFRLQVRSDESPLYPRLVQRCFPQATHERQKGRASRSSGQGELKKGGYDPLFALNHTAAMYRAQTSRLIRSTWCTTKKLEALKDHLALYAVLHNRRILAQMKAEAAAAAAAAA